MPALVVFTGGDELVVREAPDEVVARLEEGERRMAALVDAQSGERAFVNSSAVAWVRSLSAGEVSDIPRTDPTRRGG